MSVIAISPTKRKHDSYPAQRTENRELLGLHRETGHTEYVFFNDKTKKPRADLKNGFGTACAIAGLSRTSDFTIYDTAATRLADAGMNTREIMAIAQRQTRTVPKVPTIAKRRQVPTA
jgi:hypothetical protein